MKIKTLNYQPDSGSCPKSCGAPDARFTRAFDRIITVECPNCGTFPIDQAKLDDFLSVAR